MPLINLSFLDVCEYYPFDELIIILWFQHLHLILTYVFIKRMIDYLQLVKAKMKSLYRHWLEQYLPMLAC
jgi:hypothetical protein